MAFSPELIKYMECPVDGAKVELKPDGSGVKCMQCSRVYPIREDIPVMIEDQAFLEDEAAT